MFKALPQTRGVNFASAILQIQTAVWPSAESSLALFSFSRQEAPINELNICPPENGSARVPHIPSLHLLFPFPSHTREDCAAHFFIDSGLLAIAAFICIHICMYMYMYVYRPAASDPKDFSQLPDLVTPIVLRYYVNVNVSISAMNSPDPSTS